MLKGKETITVLRKNVLATKDNYGNLDYITSSTNIAYCMVAPGASTLEVDTTGYENENIITIYAPQNSDIKSSDEIFWNEERYLPIGNPIQWTTQYGSPNKPRTIVVCRLVEVGYI